MIQTTPNLSIHCYTLISPTGYPFLRAYFHDIFDFCQPRHGNSYPAVHDQCNLWQI